MSASQRTLRSGTTVWLRDAPGSTPRYPVLTGRHETDVAIVGGGITGALTAQAFASAGIGTMLLEAEAVGRGSTAASSALLMQELDSDMGALERRYGARAGKRIWKLAGESVRHLMALLTRLRIRCDLERRDAIYYAMDAPGAEALRREFLRRKSAGFTVEWLDAADLRRATAIAGRAAIRSRGGATLDPYRACVGVAAAAAAAGAGIFERSKVRRIVTGKHHVRLYTAGGRIEARRVVVATGYATPYFRPLAGRFRMYRTCVLATRPMPAAERRDLGLSDVMMWDTSRPYHYARWTPEHRLLIGGGDRPVRPGQPRLQQFEACARDVRGYFERVLPVLATVDTAYAWEGLFAMTADGLPYIGPHRRYPHHLFALGYGGNGMTFGALAARLLLERWQDGASPDHALFAFDRIRG